MEGPEDRGAGAGKQQAEHEIPDYEGAHHAGDAVHRFGSHEPRLSLEDLEEAAVEVLAPAQHEVNQKGDEGGHERDLVERRQVRIEKVHQGRTFGADANLRHHHAGNGRENGRGVGSAVPRRRGVFFCCCCSCRSWSRKRLGTTRFTMDCWVDSARAMTWVGDVGDPLAVLGQVVRQAGGLGPDAQTQQVDHEHADGADQEAGQASGQAQAHEQGHERLEDEGDDDRGG